MTWFRSSSTRSWLWVSLALEWFEMAHNWFGWLDFMKFHHSIQIHSVWLYLSTPSSFRHGRRANGRSARVVGALDRFEVCRGWVAAEGGNHTNGGRQAASPTGEAAYWSFLVMCSPAICQTTWCYLFYSCECDECVDASVIRILVYSANRS